MSRPTIMRAIAATLAIGALAAPAASARPIQDLRSADARDAAAQATKLQDLRSADARDAAQQAQKAEEVGRVKSADIQTSSLAGTTSKDPTYWAYDYQAPDPKTAGALAMEQHYMASTVRPPSVPPNVAVVTTDDDGPPWGTIGLILATAALAGAAGAGIASKTRVRRSGVAV